MRSGVGQASGRRGRDLGMAEARVDARLSARTLTRRLAVEAEEAAFGVSRDERLEIGGRECAVSRETRGICRRAYSGEMWGSRPEPEDVTASAGTEPVTASSVLTAVTASLTESASFFEVGPRFVAARGGRVVAAARAEGRPWKCPGMTNDCPISERADDGEPGFPSSFLRKLPPAFSRNATRPTPQTTSG